MTRRFNTQLLSLVVAGAATLSACSGNSQGGGSLVPVMGASEQSAQNFPAGSLAGRAALSTQRALATASAAPGYGAAVLSASPIAYYPLNSGNATLTDASPHQLNGVYGSLDSASGSALRLNAAASESLPGGHKYGFDKSRYDQVAQSPQLQPTTLSVEAWLKLAAANASGANVSVIAYGPPSSGGEPYLLELTPNNQMEWSILGAGAGGTAVTGHTTLSPNVPYHVVGTYDGATLAIYVNGKLDGSAAAPGPIRYTGHGHEGLSIGGALDSQSATFAGDMSDVAIYGNPLSAATILEHYQLGTTGSSPSPQPTATPTAPATLPPGVTLNPETPKTAFAFRDSFGVDTAFGDYKLYGAPFATLSHLLYGASITHLRDGNAGVLPGIYYMPMFQTLCQNGVHHSVGFPIGVTSSEIIAGINQYGPQCIDFVEPQNEMDALAHYGKSDPNWPQEIIAEQTLLYKTVKSVPAFANITVLGPALSNPSNYQLLGNLEAISDAGNQHSSSCDGNPGTTFYEPLAHKINRLRVSWPTKPIWTTETAYNDDPSVGGHCAVPDDVMAKYVARTQAMRFNLNQPRVYWFSFKNTPTAASFSTEGLLNVDNSPKPAYLEMASLMQLVGDATGGNAPSPINWALTGPSTIDHTLLQRSDGTYELMLWNEVPSLNPVSHVVNSSSSQNVTVYLGPNLSATAYYTFNTSYQMVATPIAQTGAGFTLPISDNISVLEFK